MAQWAIGDSAFVLWEGPRALSFVKGTYAIILINRQDMKLEGSL